MGDFESQPRSHGRLGIAFERIELFYLRVLRTTILIIATLLLAAVLIWAAVSVYKITRSPSSVHEQPSVVAASELLDANEASASASQESQQSKNTADQQAFYDGFLKKYYALYRAKYQPYQRSDDKNLAVGEFDDLSIDTANRMRAIREGKLDFATDKADLNTFLPVIAQASGAPKTKANLTKYKSAQKQRVATQVQHTRTETRRGWDNYSTDCPSWYEYPIGCAVTRHVQVPYVTTEYVMRFPDGIQSPIQVLKDYQDRYFSLLADRREKYSIDAAEKRQDIIIGKARGWAGLSHALTISGAFLGLMFFFLLIAIERHQRRLAHTFAQRSHGLE